MSVRVRLTRVGSKKNPIWRVVVADQRSPRDGRFIETIGRYNPQTEPSTIAIDEERLQHWLARGAQPTGAVKQLMKAQAKSGASQIPEPEPEPAAPAPGPAAPAPGPAAPAPGPAEPAPGGAPAPSGPAEPEPGAAPAPSGATPEPAESVPADVAQGEPRSATTDS
jgi:small subunit ribosomal protein S16